MHPHPIFALLPLTAFLVALICARIANLATQLLFPAQFLVWITLILFSIGTGTLLAHFL